MMKKLLGIVLAGAMVLGLAACGEASGTPAAASSGKPASTAASSEKPAATTAPASTSAKSETTAPETTITGDASAIKIGAIMVGDATESYTKAHEDGIRAAAAACGISEDQIEWKERIEETEDCFDSAKQLVADGCTLIISNSYGHQDFIDQAAGEFPDVNFVAMTGDFAAISGKSNLFNAFTHVYESRYVSGVVAGMKLQELIDKDMIPASGYDADGNIKIGYVGAYPYAEVVSGFTAFFLGIRSVVKNVAMEVYYTSSWFSIEAEAAAADVLLKDGCVIIGQHADSTGAPDTVQKAYDNGTVCFSVGYNVDMLSTAPQAALTSATNVWAAYYTQLFASVINGTEIKQDVAYGYADGGVAITPLGPNVAPGTAEKVAEIEADLAAGKLQVFDTSTFTVDGKELTSAPVDFSYMDWATMTPVYVGETIDVIETDANGVSYFNESYYRSAPYFSFIIDGITEMNN